MKDAKPVVPRWRREDGVTAMEYALIGILVSIIGIVALKSVGTSLIMVFQALQAGFE